MSYEKIRGEKVIQARNEMFAQYVKSMADGTEFDLRQIKRTLLKIDEK